MQCPAMMSLNSSWSKGKATSAKGKSASAVRTHHSADGSPHNPATKTPAFFIAGNNGFSLQTVHCRLHHAKTWPDLGWTENNKQDAAHSSKEFSTLLFHLAVWWRVLFLRGCSSTKISLVCDWNQCCPLPPASNAGLQYASAEDQEKDGTAFSHCLPLFTEQLCKIGFYVIHWDRQERHLHTVTASGGILVIAGVTSQRGTIPRHTSGKFLPSNYFHISCMKTNQCYQRSIGQCLLA